MATEPNHPESPKRLPWLTIAAILVVLLIGVLAVGTRQGWFFGTSQLAADEQSDEKKETKKKKEEFEIGPPAIEPAEPESPAQYVKPGHWAAASQPMRANVRDFVGQLRIDVTNPQNRPYPIAQTPYVLLSQRPVVLTKAQLKVIESTFFVPETSEAMRLNTQLEERGVGIRLPSDAKLAAMPSYQYYFVILAKQPPRYGYVKTLDTVNVPFDGETEFDDTDDTLHYRVVTLAPEKTIPLPDNPLTWSSIAYILWDEIDPQLFTAEQQRALVDWLFWGGQLIVSGPDSLDLLKGSFLDALLPATNGGARTLAAGDPALAELNSAWTIDSPTAPGRPLSPAAPWSAIKLNVRNGAEAVVGTGKLFVERRVGRGRIVVSAMQLAERDLINWRDGFDSLFNAVLMRRPPREYRPGVFGGINLAWADPELKDRRLDARLTTNVRVFARDAGVQTAYQYEDVQNELGSVNQYGVPQNVREYVPPDIAGGIGAWNDFSATPDAARRALREAAGVEVPGASFVVLALLLYLVVLVPINWLVFHAIGRVEWAWVAAPLIAIIGTLVVVERARLDIGFVRAHTEIALLEQQPDHSRAHLSRYTALYASLSSTYNLESANLTTLAAPFPTRENFPMLIGQGFERVEFERYDKVRLAGLPISSNSTGMVHSEQMFALDGPLRMGRSAARGGRQLENRTSFEFHSACLVRRPTRDEAEQDRRKLEGRWIGQLLPGQSISIPGRMPRVASDDAPFAKERTEEAKLRGTPALVDLEPMFRLALDPKHIEEGEVRLVARIDQVLPGQTITPAASQVNGAALVVAHLEYSPLTAPRPDVNRKQDIKTTVDDLETFELN